MKEPLAGANGRGKPLSRRGCYSRCGRATGRRKDLANEFAAFIVLALALGFKHSYDADHLVAVSNLITRSGSVRKTSLMSVAWAAGHMVTAAIITVLLYTFRQTLLPECLAHLDPRRGHAPRDWGRRITVGVQCVPCARTLARPRAASA